MCVYAISFPYDVRYFLQIYLYKILLVLRQALLNLALTKIIIYLVIYSTTDNRLPPNK